MRRRAGGGASSGRKPPRRVEPCETQRSLIALLWVGGRHFKIDPRDRLSLFAHLGRPSHKLPHSRSADSSSKSRGYQRCLEMIKHDDMPDITVLVLGLGGNVSQGILKALRLSSLSVRVIGACVSPTSAGLYGTDRSLISPPAADLGFADWLIDTCRTEGVHAVLTGVEPILEVLADRPELEANASAKIIVSSPAALAVGADKLRTSQWLRDHGLGFARSVRSEDEQAARSLAAECGFPLIAKPRRGKGSQGVILIDDHAALQRISNMSDYVVQEYLGSPDAEYTVGCWSDRDARVRGCIVMRRELTAGTTTAVRVESLPSARAEAVKIASELRPLGPCNVQMRIVDGRPVCFEINVRFSGTTPIRARLGFNDVDATLRHYVLGEPAMDLPEITSGSALRLWREIYPDLASMAILEGGNALDNPYESADVNDGWQTHR
jgi:carbamoyl-phosphate synthase large subunit